MPGPRGGCQDPKGGPRSPKGVSAHPKQRPTHPRHSFGVPGVRLVPSWTPGPHGVGVSAWTPWGASGDPSPMGAIRDTPSPSHWGHPGPIWDLFGGTQDPLGPPHCPPPLGPLGGTHGCPRARPPAVCVSARCRAGTWPRCHPPPRCHPGTGGGGGDRAPPPVPIFLYFESNLCFFCCFFLTSINIYRSCRLRPHAGGWAGLKGEGEGLKWGGA